MFALHHGPPEPSREIAVGAFTQSRDAMGLTVVQDIMTTPVIHVDPECSLQTLVGRMHECRISCVVVCKGLKPVGIITERDLARVLSEGAADCRASRTAKDLMSSPVVSVNGDDRIDEAGPMAQNLTIRHLPVVDSRGRLIGITTQTDLLRAYIRDLEELVAERTDKLSATVERLEEANATKTRFLANMCHEIRSPMTAILGYADCLLEDGTLSEAPASRIDSLHAIRRNGKHLMTVLNDVLDMSKLDAGKADLEAIAVSPMEVVDDVAMLFRRAATEKGLKLEVKYDGLVPATIQTDPTRLRQILINLMGNAIKFTDEGGVLLAVTFLASDEGESLLRFLVADTGSGMSPDALERVFEAFMQADASTTREHGGTGLGLAISRELAQLLGGRLEGESIDGIGSTFTLTISTGPLGDVLLVDPEAESAESRDIEDSLSTRAYLAEVKARKPQGSILVVEDARDIQRLISATLEKVGFTVAGAVNGLEGKERALAACDSGQPFDVILMDMQMPVLDGYDATRELRVAGYALPIIALTAHTMQEDRSKCLAAGCNDYLTKPVDRRRLVQAILKFLSKPPSTPRS